jgi:hypothetical protein
MSGAVLRLAEGLYSRLDGSVTYNSATVPVYGQWVTDSADFPYIVINQVALSEYGTSTQNGSIVEVDVHVFDRAASPIGVMTIAESIYGLLHRQEASITVTGFNLYQIQQEAMRVVPEGDKDTARRIQHSVCTYECYLEKI